MIEKIIKLCEHICSRKYPIDNLAVLDDTFMYINGFTFDIKNNNTIKISNEFGVCSISNVSSLDLARVKLSFNQVKVYSENLISNSLDEALKETIKIDNVTDLNFDEQ